MKLTKTTAKNFTLFSSKEMLDEFERLNAEDVTGRAKRTLMYHWDSDGKRWTFGIYAKPNALKFIETVLWAYRVRISIETNRIRRDPEKIAGYKLSEKLLLESMQRLFPPYQNKDEIESTWGR